jgi:ABC-2 type transport system permease protein
MRTVALAGRVFKEVYRDRAGITLGIIYPAMLMVIFVLIEGHVPVDIFEPINIMPGITVFSFAFLTMFSASMLARDREKAFLVRLLTTPLKPSEFILAYSLPYFLIALLQTAVMFLTGTLFGAPAGIGYITSLLFLLPTAMICIGIGMILGSLFSESALPAPGTITIVIIAFFSGAFADFKMIGGIIRTIALVLPFSHAVDGIRSILAGNPLSEVMNSLYMVIAYALLFYLLGVLFFRWRTRSI